MTAPNMELRRPRQAEPTEDGLYYARQKRFKPEESRMTVVEVVYRDTAGYFVVKGIGDDIPWHGLAGYDWFGPVPTCEEACV